jgi:hypothetical protein
MGTMSMKLTNSLLEDTVFSPREQLILKIILKRSVLSIAELTNYVYKGKKKPLQPNNGIGNAVRMINKKCEYFKLDWYLNSDIGHQGKSVWIEKL